VLSVLTQRGYSAAPFGGETAVSNGRRRRVEGCSAEVQMAPRGAICLLG
jgi:hypothetical protein